MPSLNPVTTSSNTSSAPYSSHRSRTAALKSRGAGWLPDSGPTGSSRTAAVPPVAALAASLARSATRSPGGVSLVAASAVAGERPGGPDRGHDRLGAGAEHPELVHRGHEVVDQRG